MARLEKIAMAIDYFEANLTKKVDLDMVANAVHYSKYHLHRMFSETLGMTFHDYLQRRQLTEAAKLLVFSNKSILEIAQLSGYESQKRSSWRFFSTSLIFWMRLFMSIPPEHMFAYIISRTNVLEKSFCMKFIIN